LPDGDVALMYVLYCCGCNTLYDAAAPDRVLQAARHLACVERLLQSRLALARRLDYQLE
jgi:hypothetical protein